jgi:glycosyltransferase involved in cell wall biosynthesis
VLDSKSPVYKTELRSLKFVRSVALAMPDTDFVVIGASNEAIQNRLDYAEVKNLRLIGLVYDDVQMSELYRNALCFFYPYRIPGFSNRLMDAFFYGKAIVTTSLTNKYYNDFVPNRDVVFADTPDVAVEALKKISSSEYCRRKFEDASHLYYLTHYSPEKHAKAVERVLRWVACKTR